MGRFSRRIHGRAQLIWLSTGVQTPASLAWRRLAFSGRLDVGEIKMTDWETDLDALVQEAMAITKSIRVEPPIPRTVVEPNRMSPVNLNNSERDEI